MTDKEKDFLKPRKGEVDPAEKTRLVDEALHRRRSATHQFYWMSLDHAAFRWENGRGISSAVFEGVRRPYTDVTFFNEPPPNSEFKDFKLVGKLRIKQHVEFYQGITREMFENGEFIRIPDDRETYAVPDPTESLLPPGVVPGKIEPSFDPGNFDDED